MTRDLLLALRISAFAVVAVLTIFATSCKDSNDVVAPTNAVSGIVRRGNVPVQGAYVWADASGYRSQTTTSGTDGTYSLSGLTSGTLTVHASWQHGDWVATETVTVPPSTSNFDLILANGD